jgi:hypothetical protein
VLILSPHTFYINIIYIYIVYVLVICILPQFLTLNFYVICILPRRRSMHFFKKYICMYFTPEEEYVFFLTICIKYV